MHDERGLFLHDVSMSKNIICDVLTVVVNIVLDFAMVFIEIQITLR